MPLEIFNNLNSSIAQDRLDGKNQKFGDVTGKILSEVRWNQTSKPENLNDNFSLDSIDK